MARYGYALPRAYRRPRRYRSPYGRRSGGQAGAVVALGAVALAAATSAHAVTSHHAKPAVHAPAAANPAAAKAIAFARAQLGKPYAWGGTGPDAFDCSGLVMKAYASAGVSIDRTSQGQWATLPHVPRGKVRPGDLVFFAGSDGTRAAPGHVGLVIGKNTMIEAYATGTPIRVSTFGTAQSPGGDEAVVGYARPQAPASPARQAAPGTGEAGFLAAVLSAVGAPDTGANQSSMAAWVRHETTWPPVAASNPMNTTLAEPGSTAYNVLPGGGSVQNYPSAAEGVRATAATLLGGYPLIVAALRSGTGICGGGFASELLTWSGNGYSEVC